MGHDQVSGGVSVLCWLPTPVAMFYGNLRNLVIKSKSVIKSISVIISQIGVMSDQLRVSLRLTKRPESKAQGPSTIRHLMTLRNENFVVVRLGSCNDVVT